MAEDQGAIAWSHVLQQHRRDEGAEGFFRAFYAPLTGAANACDDLSLALVLDTAEGARLDLIGSIVGAARDVVEGTRIPYFGFRGFPATVGFGAGRFRRRGDPAGLTYRMPDAEYRTVIRAKVFLNNARGTAPEIEAAARVAYRAPRVSVVDTGDASAEVRVGRIFPSTDPLFRTLPKLLGRAAGVRLTVTFESAATPFGFRGYPNTYGFRAGQLGRRGGSQ